MPPWIRSSAAWAGTQVPTLLTLAVLAGVALWGSTNDWKIPHAWGGSAKETKETAEATIRVVADPSQPQSRDAGPGSLSARRIEFPSVDSVQKAGIEMAPVEVRSIARYVTANGTIDYEPSRYARLTARATGTVWRLEKEAGDTVHKGEVVALVDAAEVGRAKAEFLQSLAQVRLYTTSVQQLQSLDKSGAVSDRSLREAEAKLREARISLFNNQQALLNLGLPFRLKEVEGLAEDQLVKYLRLLGLPDDLRKQLDSETLTANLLPVTAPFDGQVVQRYAALGELQQLTQPKPMYMVADLSRLHFELDVNPEDVADVRLGQTVSFLPEGARSPAAEGALSHISPEVDEKTRRVRVHAEFDNPGGRLRPNTFGTGKILIRKHAHARVIPSVALQTLPTEGENQFVFLPGWGYLGMCCWFVPWKGEIQFVFVRLSPTSFQARQVQTGLREGDLLEVTGIRPGEEVVTTGSFMLKSELLKERIAGDGE